MNNNSKSEDDITDPEHVKITLEQLGFQTNVIDKHPKEGHFFIKDDSMASRKTPILDLESDSSPNTLTNALQKLHVRKSFAEHQEEENSKQQKETQQQQEKGKEIVFSPLKNKDLDMQDIFKNKDMKSLDIEQKPSQPINIDFPQMGKMNVIDFIENNFHNNKNKPKVSSPPLPRRQVVIATCLLLIGMLLLITGTVKASNDHDSSTGVAFWIIGGLCALPGLFYAIKLCQAIYMKSVEGKRKVLQDLPQD